MKYVVKSRELKWAGQTLLKGAEVQPKSDRDHQHIELLAKIGKVELAPEKKPVRHVATMKAPVAEVLAAEEAPEPVPQEADDPALEIDTLVPRTYRTRRLKSED